jgi:1-phosphofructokinase
MISTVTLNPAIDKTIYVSKLIPNDTNRVTKVEIDAGGKGVNCARMLKKLGVDTSVITLLGGTTGDIVKCVLDKEGIPVECVITDKPTRTCICIEEGTGIPPTTLNERGGPIEHSELVSLFELAKDISRKSSYVVFGGSVPTGINQDVYKVLIDIASAGGAKSILDADGEALAIGMKARPFMIKPNLDEVERLLGLEFESQSDVARAALTLGEQGIELVVISMGKQGAIACYQDLIYHASVPAIKCISTIGSGDSMVAGMLCALEQGADISDALKLGCAAGAATAMSGGTDIGSKEDVDKLLNDVKVAKIEPSPVGV